MPRTKGRKTKEITVDSYAHKGRKRKNNPHVGLVSSATDKLNGRTKYKHDPHIGPTLSWAGKQEGMSFEVQNVSLHIHERIDPKRIIKNFIKKRDPKERQLEFFAQPENELALAKAIDFYRHEQEWTNRLIAGDSLLVMNSLLKKEGMAGKVQMVYIDPPYGIKYNSNFQPFVNKRDVKDGNDADIPAEPEMIQAFRDTWELGVHSYLTYLRDRLLLARDLLHDSGSCFVQISDENIHHVRELMDELFGVNNFVSVIQFKKTAYQETSLLPNVCDFLIWYAKNKPSVKCHQLYQSRPDEMIESGFTWLELEDGKIIKAPKKISDDPPGSKRFQSSNLTSQGSSEEGSKPFVYQNRTYEIGNNKHWKTSRSGLEKLAQKGRLFPVGNTLSFKRYASDFPCAPYSNMWDDTIRSTFSAAKLYVVETNPKVIERCILMTSDPGDLIFDPTCGGGTTAYASELWGRRWITCDTSRVAVTLTKQRLMTSKFDYFNLAHPNEGLKSGFKYNELPHITLKSIANDQLPSAETLYDQPVIEKNKVRVSGPFTVEAVPCLRVKPFDGNEPDLEVKSVELARIGETGRQAEWRDELKATGIRTVGGKIITFSRVEPMLATRFLHADGEVLESDGVNKKAYISFGPDYGPLDQRQIEEAIKEARSLKDKPDFVIFAAFHFDPEAAKDIDQINWPAVKILKAQMSVDLLTKDLRKNRSSSQSYWLIGQPDVEVLKQKDGKFKVRVNGFDYYDPVTGEIKSGGTKHIAMWFLDTDYDERSLYPDQVFFPDGDEKRGWAKLAKALNGEVNEDLLEHFSSTESIPFSAGEQKKIGVKIVDNRGIESFVIKKLS